MYAHSVVLGFSGTYFVTLITNTSISPIDTTYLKNLANQGIKLVFHCLSDSDVDTALPIGAGAIKKLDATTYYFGWNKFSSGSGNQPIENATITDTIAIV